MWQWGAVLVIWGLGFAVVTCDRTSQFWANVVFNVSMWVLMAGLVMLAVGGTVTFLQHQQVWPFLPQ